jgi:hypothetical protein
MIRDQASEPLEANSDLYPPPNQNPERYQPVTKQLAEQRRLDGHRLSEQAIAASRPLEEDP